MWCLCYYLYIIVPGSSQTGETETNNSTKTMILHNVNKKEERYDKNQPDQHVINSSDAKNDQTSIREKGTNIKKSNLETVV